MNPATGDVPFPALAQLHESYYTEPFWAAARDHRLVCQRCAACGTFRFPPAPTCWSCLSPDVEWVELPGTGTIYTYSAINYSLTPEIREEDLPYVVVVVELDGAEGNKAVGNLVGAGSDTPFIGMRVQVAWHDVPQLDSTIPAFTPRDNS